MLDPVVAVDFSYICEVHGFLNHVLFYLCTFFLHQATIASL